MESTCSILDLPLDVMIIIYKEIKEEKDKINLVKAHVGFGFAFAIDAGNRYEKIMFDERPMQEWKLILPLCGETVTQIVTKKVRTSVKVTKLASMFCPNLEEFFLPVRSHFWNHVAPLLATLKHLKWIGLCNNYDRIKVVKTLRLLSNLKYLDLIKFPLKDMLAVKHLVKLEYIRIVNYRQEFVNLYQMCSGMKNLHSVDIRNVEIRFPKETDDAVLWPKMRLVKIGFGKFYTQLPFMPDLKCLTIENTKPTTKLNHIFGTSILKYAQTLQNLRFCSEIIRDLVESEVEAISHLESLKELECQLDNGYIESYISRLKQLEFLNLQNSKRLTNYGVCILLSRCKKIRKLNLYGCTRINRALVRLATIIMLDNGAQPDNPLVLRVGHGF
ncbi:hypothetical protein KR074_009521, partial [Drosophila pseudoananassae]